MDIVSKCKIVKQENMNSALNTTVLYALTARIFGKGNEDKFIFRNLGDAGDERDRFSITNENGKIVIGAVNTISAAAALNCYLKEIGCHYSLLGRQMNLPEHLPPAKKTISVSPFMYRYFLNYCTFGYSFAFWDWEQYEKLIDYMALSGINLALNIVGFEEVLRRTFISAGYTNAQIKRFFVGANYLPWLYMGNMSGFGGELHDEWFKERARLGRKIQKRMIDLGIEPVVPGYCGMIPNDYGEHFPGSRIITQGEWCGIRRPDILSFEDKNFKNISVSFYKSLKEVYGADIHYFSIDPFHEGGNIGDVDLSAYAAVMQNMMQTHFPKSVSVFQGWQRNPNRDILKGMKKEYALVINLLSDVTENTDFDNFAGTPWLFGTVNNYGGNNIVRGNFNAWAQKPFEMIADSSRTMVGIGLLPEGVCCDQILFEIFTDIGFMKSSPDKEEWLKQYITRRYGRCSERVLKAFTILVNDVYAVDSVEGTKESAVCARPALDISTVGTWGSSVFGYDVEKLTEAVKMLYGELEQFGQSECFQFDFIDYVRQCMSNTSWDCHKEIKAAHKEKSIAKLTAAAGRMYSLIRLEEELVSCKAELLLGNHLKSAKARGTTPREKRNMEQMARTQITLWGDRAGSEFLHDYCQREWQGMLSDFYLPRWKRFIGELERCIAENRPYKEPDWYDFDYEFTLSQKEYPLTPKNNLRGVCKKIFESVLSEKGEPHE